MVEPASIANGAAQPRSIANGPAGGITPAVKFAVIFLFAFMVTVNGFDEPVASTLHDVKV